MVSQPKSTYDEGLGSIRDGRFRYIRYPDNREELYDHQTDQQEWKNLVDEPAFAVVKGQPRHWIPQKYAATLGGRQG